MIRVAVHVPRSRAALAALELLKLSPGGIEERDLDGDMVELAIYLAAGEMADFGSVNALLGDTPVEVHTTEVADDWSERWRDWHRPLDVGPLRVRPSWEPPRAGALDVVIDPGQAFGTGAHPSTRLSLELLCDLPAGGQLADWGCGSGVLALAAARLGFDPVLACDHDLAAVEATLAGAAANGIAARRADDAAGATPRASAGATPRISGGDPSVLVSQCDLRRAPGPWAPTVTANLVRPLLLEVAALMARPPERLIASGLENAEADEVAAAFARHGLREAARRDGDGWSAILLAR